MISVKSNTENPFEDPWNNYHIIRTLGMGAFGKVFCIEEIATRTEYAMKEIKKNDLNDVDYIRIHREIEILSQVSHENWISWYKLIETPESYHIIMPHCQRGELFDYIEKTGKVNEEETSFFFYQLVNAVHYLHRHHIVHRDIKPENILLTENYKIQWIDFGLSNYYKNDKYLKTPCGSLCYAPPEMLRGEDYNGVYSDIWSLGIVLYVMICGYLPFDDDDNEILFRKIVNVELLIPDHVSGMVKDVLNKMWVGVASDRIGLEEIMEYEFYKFGEKTYKNYFKDEIKGEEEDKIKVIRKIRKVELQREKNENIPQTQLMSNNKRKSLSQEPHNSALESACNSKAKVWMSMKKFKQKNVNQIILRKLLDSIRKHRQKKWNHNRNVSALTSMQHSLKNNEISNTNHKSDLSSWLTINRKSEYVNGSSNKNKFGSTKKSPNVSHNKSASANNSNKSTGVPKSTNSKLKAMEKVNWVISKFNHMIQNDTKTATIPKLRLGSPNSKRRKISPNKVMPKNVIYQAYNRIVNADKQRTKGRVYHSSNVKTRKK